MSIYRSISDPLPPPDLPRPNRWRVVALVVASALAHGALFAALAWMKHADDAAHPVVPVMTFHAHEAKGATGPAETTWTNDDGVQMARISAPPAR
jgi:hypothetical protein